MADLFEQMKLSPEILANLQKMGIKEPMPVQQQAIPALLKGKDVIVRAQTGMGKTLAYLIPLAQKLDPGKNYVQAMVLTPTRELAQQVAVEMKKLLGENSSKVAAIVGGSDFELQKHKLEGRAQVLIGTPGRVLDHLGRGSTDLGGVTYLVLDEVDEMLAKGFAEEVMTLVGMVNKEHQTMLCSATLDEEVRKLGLTITKNRSLIDLSSDNAVVEKIKQICIKTTEEGKLQALTTLIDRVNPYLMIVFCISKERAREVNDYLGAHGYNSDVLEGDMSAAKRKTVMKEFREARLQILVASDLAARGLDVEGVTQVVNYDIPHNVDWYVHRVGRTGRAGRDGVALTFYTAEDLHWLHNIESKLNFKMERQNLDGKVILRRVSTKIKAKPKAKTRGRNSVWDKRHAPKTGSNRRQVSRKAGAEAAGTSEEKAKTSRGRKSGEAVSMTPEIRPGSAAMDKGRRRTGSSRRSGASAGKPRRSSGYAGTAAPKRGAKPGRSRRS